MTICLDIIAGNGKCESIPILFIAREKRMKDFPLKPRLLVLKLDM